MPAAINVKVIMQEIRARVREHSALQKPKTAPALPSGTELPDLTGMERISQDLHNRRVAIGEMPPEPPTLRGRIGSLLVKLVRRALSWQTLQLNEFHADIVRGYDQQLAAVNRVVASTQQSRQLIEDLWSQVANLSAELERANR